MKLQSAVPYSCRPTANLLDLYLPEGEGPFPLMVFFYGGGLVSGCRTDNRDMAIWFAEHGVAVALPDYRLMPEYRYPSFIEDASEAVAWCSRNVPHSTLFVGGHSAGASLTLMLALDKKYLAVRSIDADSIDGYLPISAQPTAHFNVLKHAGIDPRRVIVDETAPLFHVNRDTIAPMLLITAENDIPCRSVQNQLMHATLQHFGCVSEFYEMPGADHSSLLAPFHGEDTPAALPMLRFMQNITEKKAQ